MTNLEQIKKIRERLGSGIVETKKALDEAGGDEEKAIELLRKKSQLKAAKKSDREAGEGVVTAYVHPNKKLGVVVKLYCESDFVARNEEFLELAKDIAMHIAASNPECLNPEDVSAEVVEKEKAIWEEQLKSENKPAEMIAKIMEGKEKKFREGLALMSQPFVKDPSQTVSDLVTEKIAKIGENIRVGAFHRVEL